MTIADVITAISVAIAALSFVIGINAWRREFLGKRQIELAEEVLALFYEAQDAIKEIRSPFSQVGEGISREKGEHEREDEARLLDQAYIVFERYKSREKLFAELRSVRYRFMATFGSQAGEPFVNITKVLSEIFSAAHILGTHYWPRQGRVKMSDDEFQKHLNQMNKYEAIFWFMGEENDDISPRVQSAVEEIEKIARQASLINEPWYARRKKRKSKKSRKK